MRRTIFMLGLILAVVIVKGSAQAAIIADSVGEFSCVQGQNNWYYGYYDGPFTSTDFQQTTQCFPDPYYSGNAWWVDENLYWTSLRDMVAFPNGPASCGRLNVEHWAVRRWISEVAGMVTISGTLANVLGGFDGFTGHILVDGVVVWSQFIDGSDTVGVQYTHNVTVNMGSVVDFAIQPGASDCNDHAKFTATISIDVPCFSTHTSGSGTTRLQLCFSQQGTLVQLESPAGFEHLLGEEGYALCSSAGVHGFEAGVAAAGFGPPTITQPGGPNTLPLTIIRTTTDGVFQLKQTFARDTAEHDVTLTLALKNLSGVARSNVRLSRYVHGALDNGVGEEEYDTTPDTVWGRDTHGLMLTALTFGTTHTTAVEAFGDWNPLGGGGTARGCDATAQPTPTAPGNFVGRVTYTLGTLNPGSSKTVKVLYRRF